MSHRILGFLKCMMNNAINSKCGFTRGSKPKRGNIIDIYNKLAHTKKRRPQLQTTYI